MTDQLRQRLARLDPMHPGVGTEPLTTESSRNLLEEIMSTPVTEQPPAVPEPKPRRWLVGVAAAAALVIAVGGAIASSGNGEDPVASGPPLELTATGDDPMAMLGLALGQRRQMRDLGTHKEHGRGIFAYRYTGTAPDTRCGVHGVLRSILRHRQGVGLRSIAGVDGNESASGNDTIKG